jgi:hypothetical protein
VRSPIRTRSRKLAAATAMPAEASHMACSGIVGAALPAARIAPTAVQHDPQQLQHGEHMLYQPSKPACDRCVLSACRVQQTVSAQPSHTSNISKQRGWICAASCTWHAQLLGQTLLKFSSQCL